MSLECDTSDTSTAVLIHVLTTTAKRMEVGFVKTSHVFGRQTACRMRVTLCDVASTSVRRACSEGV